jgi:hypothetical protein
MEKIFSTAKTKLTNQEMLLLQENVGTVERFYEEIQNMTKPEHIVVCKNGFERKIVHMLCDVLDLYHMKYFERDDSWTKHISCQDLSCTFCYKTAKGMFHCNVIGVKVSSVPLVLYKKDIKHKKQAEKLRRNYKLSLNNSNNMEKF